MSVNKPSLDALFGGCGTETIGNEIAMLKSSTLIPYPEHPFKMYTGARLDDLVESVREVGVLEPIIVMETATGEHIILAGHNRNNANLLAGNTEIPTVVKKNISSGETKLIVTHTNFNQRGLSDFLPSEKAKAFKLELEGLKEQRKNLKRVNEIAVRAASDISYLTSEMQQAVDNCIKLKSAKLDIVKADQLKKATKNNLLDIKMLQEILFVVANKQQQLLSIKIQPTIIAKYFTHGEKKIDVEQTIEKALEMYFSTTK